MELTDEEITTIHEDIKKYAKKINALIEITSVNPKNQKFKFLLLIHLAKELEENLRKRYGNKMVDEGLGVFAENFPIEKKLIKRGDLEWN